MVVASTTTDKRNMASQSETESVKVVVRCRPLIQRQLETGEKHTVQCSSSQISLNDEAKSVTHHDSKLCF